jgi:hypothetical protein
MNFDRINYHAQEGVPIANEMRLNTTNAINCCVACQNTVSPTFYLPSPPTTSPNQ